MGWKGLSRSHIGQLLLCSDGEIGTWLYRPQAGAFKRIQSLFYFCFPDFYIYCLDITDDIGFLLLVLIKFLWNIYLLKQERSFRKSCVR